VRYQCATCPSLPTAYNLVRYLIFHLSDGVLTLLISVLIVNLCRISTMIQCTSSSRSPDLFTAPLNRRLDYCQQCKYLCIWMSPIIQLSFVVTNVLLASSQTARKTSRTRQVSELTSGMRKLVIAFMKNIWILYTIHHHYVTSAWSALQANGIVVFIVLRIYVENTSKLTRIILTICSSFSNLWCVDLYTLKPETWWINKGRYASVSVWFTLRLNLAWLIVPLEILPI